MTLLLALLVVLLMTAGYLFGHHRAGVIGGAQKLHSLPHYYGYYIAIWVGVPALTVLSAGLLLESVIINELVLAQLPPEISQLPSYKLNLFLGDAKDLAKGRLTETLETSSTLISAASHVTRLLTIGKLALAGVILSVSLAGFMFALKNLKAELRARPFFERSVQVVLLMCAMFAILITVGIVLSLIFEALRFFSMVSPFEFLLGLQWSPQMALRDDQVGSSGAFGAVPVFAGTMLIMVIAMFVAVPVGLFSAIYLSEYAKHSVRSVVKPLLEILAGIPTVVYGFFAALTIAPWIRDVGETLNLDVASESALAAGLVMGVMIIPFISSLSDDVINAVPKDLREGSLALGATQSETTRQVVLPAALPGIAGSILLAVSRAIGETMIVVMAAGLAANLTANPLQAVTTATVQMVTLLVGDQEFDSAKTLAAFALGLVLFCVTLILNVIALTVVRRYRERYE